MKTAAAQQRGEARRPATMAIARPNTMTVLMERPEISWGK